MVSKGKSKYRNIRVEWNGRSFHSKKEANYAQSLSMARQAVDPKDRVIHVQYQVPYDVILHGRKITRYVLDFRVHYADGRIDHVDVKGYLKGAAYDLFRIKKALVEIQEGIEIREV